MKRLTKSEIQYRNRMKELAEQWTGLKLGFINPNTISYPSKGYEIGKTYYIGYWSEFDQCIDIKDGWITVKSLKNGRVVKQTYSGQIDKVLNIEDEFVTIQGLTDGIIRSHRTTLNPIKDFIVL